MTVNHSFRHRFIRFNRINKVIPPNKSILISYSGGGDSVFLLHLLNSVKNLFNIKKIGVAFFDHGVQQDPEKSNVIDQINSLCDEFFFECLKFSNIDGSFEEKARNARYDALQRIKMESGYDLIVTGHTISDQAETVVYRFITAGFLESLRGIKVIREDNVIRPLMCFSRDEIRNYLDQNGINYWQDPSNEQEKFCVRNKIRLKVMPVLKEINPKFEFAISRLSLGLQGVVLEKI